MSNRRAFLHQLGTMGTALGLSPRLLAGAPTAPALVSAPGLTSAPAPLRLLVLGGTGFIGPHLVRLAVQRGHSVSVFTRGRQSAELPAPVERLVGDRSGDLSSLEGRRWDAVFDNSATNPDWVELSTRLLRSTAGRYLFTSSTGVYYPYLQRGVNESAAVRRTFTDPNDGSEQYGVSKVLCEERVRDAFGERALVVRPTYIVGPGDTTDRFPYWPQRLRRGGRTVAPGRRDDPVQLIDVRDLVAFMLALVESESGGTFNAAGPAAELTCSAFLAQAASALSSSSEFVWVEDYDTLLANGVDSAVPWIMLRGNDRWHTSASNARALSAGLGFRPLAETVRDTLAWWDTVPAERRERARFSISEEAERALLAGR